jgi:hypothetical protein
MVDHDAIDRSVGEYPSCRIVGAIANGSTRDLVRYRQTLLDGTLAAPSAPLDRPMSRPGESGDSGVSRPSWSRITGFLCHLSLEQGPRGTSWVSAGVLAQGAGPGRFRSRGRGRRRDLGISDQTIYAWRRQDRIDKGPEPGLISTEKAELAAARKRIAELETELAVHRRASELLGKVVPPKGGWKRSR